MKKISNPANHGLTKYTKPLFADQFAVKYDSIQDHDFYSWFRVSFEVPRETPDTAIVVLNGREVGDIIVVRDAKNNIAGFTAQRRSGANMPPIPSGQFATLASAAKAIITNFE